jgi:pyruvate,orthophosphate dikinase
MKSEKYVYRFGGDTVCEMAPRELLGNKGAGLVEMSQLLIPVPPGFVISTHACRHYFEHGTLPAGLDDEVAAAMRWLENVTGRCFNDDSNPLLVSVRSGAAVSMPGMMDTILNIGLTQKSLDGLVKQGRSMEVALDSYRRLIQMFGSVVLGVPKVHFAETSNERMGLHEAIDTKAACESLQNKIAKFKEAIILSTGQAFPEDAHQQMKLAIQAVIDSWNNDRAIYYRRLQGITAEQGTAVTVQAMVMGNTGQESGTGVGFTRDPSLGTKAIYGEFLANAQGEDIVAGTRTPAPLSLLQEIMPDIYEQLVATVERLEQYYRDVQDFEFTIENRKLYLLQTRSAKRSATAAVKIAVDMVEEGLISRQEALQRIDPARVSEILAPQLDFSSGSPEPIATGVIASAGAAVGRVVLSSHDAVYAASLPNAEPVILVTDETTADDIQGMAASAGFLTAHGGATSHAAVVARGMGKCCITGARSIVINLAEGTVRAGDKVIRAGDWISLEGSTGRVFAGKLPMQHVAEENEALAEILHWAANFANFDVRGNVDTPEDAIRARKAGARGIGLCRTEHMFFAPSRLTHMQSVILASNVVDRIAALEKLLPMQQHDFEELFREMAPFPVTIRLLDPPLHEFLPTIAEVKAELDIAKRSEDYETAQHLSLLCERIKSLSEVNPMMGHRGCRLSISYPEILEMQVRAILQAALSVTSQGYETVPEIMVPLIASAEEMAWLRRRIDATAEEVFASVGRSIPYRVGTMIELPRAAMCAGAIAKYVDFVSFGTNDLTQMTFGFSRDDSSAFLARYLQEGILTVDPFVTIDRAGVGSLIQIAMSQLKAEKPEIKIGICGEHGGDPDSIAFFASLGIDYVSCSPMRIPTALLAVSRSSLHSLIPQVSKESLLSLVSSPLRSMEADAANCIHSSIRP